MESVGRLKTIVASLENGLPLDDVPETLQWCIDTIERLTKERDAALAEVERLNAEKGEILVKLQMARADLEAEARSLGYTG